MIKNPLEHPWDIIERLNLIQNNDDDFNDYDTSYIITGNNEDKSYELYYSLNLAIRYERPLRRNLQLSANAYGYAKVNRTWKDFHRIYARDTIAYRAAVPTIGANESVTLSYYPSTRTTVAISQNVGYQRSFDFYDITLERIPGGTPPEPAADHDFRKLWLGLSGSARYYFAPQLEGVFSIGLNWSERYNAAYDNFWDNRRFETEQTF